MRLLLGLDGIVFDLDVMIGQEVAADHTRCQLAARLSSFLSMRCLCLSDTALQQCHAAQRGRDALK